MFGVIGVAVLLVVAYDLSRTTLAPASGAGPVTSTVGRFIWRTGHLGGPAPSSWRLRILGPAVLGVTFAAWVLLVGLGWWLVVLFLDGLIESSTNQVATAGERLYFVFTTLATLGPGDILPTTGIARLATGMMAITGFVLLTLSVTYILPVITAVTQRRVQARTISELGISDAAIEARLDDPDATAQLLSEVASELRVLTEKHLSYPILHYFHSPDRPTALAPSVAALDEAVGALSRRPPADRPAMLALVRFRGAVDDLLEVMENHLGSHVPPDPPARTPEVASAVEELVCRHGRDGHRRWLAALVADAGWSWEDVTGGR